MPSPLLPTPLPLQSPALKPVKAEFPGVAPAPGGTASPRVGGAPKDAIRPEPQRPNSSAALAWLPAAPPPIVTRLPQPAAAAAAGRLTIQQQIALLFAKDQAWVNQQAVRHPAPSCLFLPAASSQPPSPSRLAAPATPRRLRRGLSKPPTSPPAARRPPRATPQAPPRPGPPPPPPSPATAPRSRPPAAAAAAARPGASPAPPSTSCRSSTPSSRAAPWCVAPTVPTRPTP